MMLCSDEIFWGKMPLVVMKFVGAKYGNKNVKIILVKKCPYVVMKYIGGKSEQRTYPQGIPLLLPTTFYGNQKQPLIVHCPNQNHSFTTATRHVD